MIASLRYVVRNLGRRRTRTILGGAGIFLTIALLTAIQIGLDSVSTSYTDLVALQAGKADMIISTEGGSLLHPEPFLPSEVTKKLAPNPHLRELAPRLLGVTRVRCKDKEHYAFVIGIDPELEKQLDISGLSPEPNLSDKTCAISQSLARKLSASQGADVVVSSEATGGERGWRVGTVIERQLILPQEVRDFVVVNEAGARAMLSEPERVHFLAGAFHNPASYYDARDLHTSVLRLKDAGEALAADLGMDYAVRLPKATAIAAFEHVTSPLRAIFGVFALLVLSVTGLLIYSIISVAVEERIREYAILRTLGAKQRSIFALVLSESLFLCLLGVVPGVAAGVVVAKCIVKVVELSMRAQGGVITLAVSPTTLWLTVAAGAALSIGSALIPALQAVRWRIVDALDPLRRGQIEAPRRAEGGANRPLLLTGLALSTLSVVVFFILPTAFLSGNPSLMGTVVLCLLLTILLGFSLVAVGVLPFIEGGVMACTGWAFGPSAELARRNLTRHRRRNTTTAIMFILSVSMVIFIASLVVLFSRTSMTMVEHFNGADFRLQSEAARTDNLKSELARIDGVEAVAEARWLRSRTPGGIAYDVVISDLVGMKHLWIVPFGVDADFQNALYSQGIQYEQGGSEALAKLAGYRPAQNQAASEREAVPPMVLSLSAARFLDVQAGDLVQLSFRLGATRRDGRFRVEAVCGAMPGFNNFRSRVANAVGSGVLIPMESFAAMTREAPAEALLALYYVKARPDEETQKEVARRMRSDFDVRYQFGVKSAWEQKRSAQILYWVTQVLFGLLLTVAIVISVFALIASMANAAIERRWEIGMLKALGLRRGQLFRMFLGETVVLTLSAGIAGGAIGFSLAYLFAIEAGVLMEVPVVFTMPYLTFFATLVISVAAGAVAAHLPTRRLLGKPAAEILRLEI